MSIRTLPGTDQVALPRDRTMLGALTLFLATALGVPVSTTHTITGAIVGVGAARRVAAVRWHVAQRIVIAWVLTLPAAGLLGALAFKAVSYF